MADLYKVKSVMQVPEEDLMYIAENMKPVDVLESISAGYTSEKNAVFDAAEDDAYESYVLYTNVPEALFGVQKTGDTRLIYCLTTTDLTRHPRIFLLAGREYIERWRTHDLWNCVLKENRTSIRWLKRLGASFDHSFGWNGKQWEQFVIRKNVTSGSGLKSDKKKQGGKPCAQC